MDFTRRQAEKDAKMDRCKAYGFDALMPKQEKFRGFFVQATAAKPTLCKGECAKKNGFIRLKAGSLWVCLA